MEDGINNADVLSFVDAASGSGKYEEPRGDLECAIAQLWKELFHLERIGRNDNFFELGGNSLLGMDLSEMFFSRLEIEIPALAIFQNPTIAEAARLIEAS